MSDNSKAQAQAQLKSIIEMVAATDIETKATTYVEAMEDDAVIAAMKTYNDFDPEEDDEEDYSNIDSLREELTDLLGSGEDIDGVDFEFDEDAAWQTIDQDALSVELRGDWHDVGDDGDDVEYKILLCTGGPAVQIVGELDTHGQPESATIQHQDWFEAWQDFPMSQEEEDEVLKYCGRYIGY